VQDNGPIHRCQEDSYSVLVGKSGFIRLLSTKILFENERFELGSSTQNDELSGQMFDDELKLAAVIDECSSQRKKNTARNVLNLTRTAEVKFSLRHLYIFPTDLLPTVDSAKHLVMKEDQNDTQWKERIHSWEYLAQLHRATLCYSKSLEMLKECSNYAHTIWFKTIPLPLKATA